VFKIHFFIPNYNNNAIVQKSQTHTDF
jgi:hypothetical protein